jgi:hypothetical protein
MQPTHHHIPVLKALQAYAVANLGKGHLALVEALQLKFLKQPV